MWSISGKQRNKLQYIKFGNLASHNSGYPPDRIRKSTPTPRKVTVPGGLDPSEQGPEWNLVWKSMLDLREQRISKHPGKKSISNPGAYLTSIRSELRTKGQSYIDARGILRTPKLKTRQPFLRQADHGERMKKYCCSHKITSLEADLLFEQFSSHQNIKVKQNFLHSKLTFKQGKGKQQVIHYFLGEHRVCVKCFVACFGLHRQHSILRAIQTPILNLSPRSPRTAKDSAKFESAYTSFMKMTVESLAVSSHYTSVQRPNVIYLVRLHLHNMKELLFLFSRLVH